MAPQGHTSAPSGGAPRPADLAAGALADVAAAKERACLRAGLTPAWYGPAVAAAAIVPAVVEARLDGSGGWAPLVSLLTAFTGLAVVFVLVDVARRRTGIMPALPWFARLRRRAVPLLGLIVAGLATWGLCLQFGAGRAATRIAVFTVLGLGAWAVLVIRNKRLEQRLQDMG